MGRSRTAISSMLLGLVLAQAASAQVANWTPFGDGCPGTAGVPLLEPAQWSLPFVGEAFTCELSNLPDTGLGVGIIGFSDQMWGGFELPLDMNTVLPMPGCTLYTDVRRTTTLTIAGGRASWPLNIPQESSLHGVCFFQQAFIVDPGVSGLGAVMSNAGKGVIEAFSGALTVEVLGGPMDTEPQEGVRVLRHDVVTGEILDDQMTGMDGIVDFGMIGTSRTTLSVVVPPNAPLFEGDISTLMNTAVGDLTIIRPGEESAVQASFDVSLTGVPAGVNSACVLPGEPRGGDELCAFSFVPPTASITNVNVRYLQPDGRFSILTEAGIDGPGVSGCGMLLDVDPASITPGSTLTIPTSTQPTLVPYMATEPVFTVGTLIRRSGLIFGSSTFTGPASSGHYSVCAIPGADRYAFWFEGDADLCLIFDAIPASMNNVTIPDLSITALSGDAATRTASWTTGGSDSGGLDVVELDFEWFDPMSSSFLDWNLLMPGHTENVTLPELPSDLSVFEPPAGTEFGLEIIDVDVINGYDDLIAQMSAWDGNIVSVILTGRVVKGKEEEGVW